MRRPPTQPLTPAVLLVVLLTATLIAGTEPHLATLSIRVEPRKAVHTMDGGIGASFHAIETPIEGHAGSAWGANPDPGDDRAWASLLAHADWLGLDWCRVEIEQRMYEPERDRFEWDSRDMRVLYRILDWTESRHIDVFLQQMWQNIRWNAYPEFQGEQKLWLKSAPLDVQAFAESYAAMTEHLVKDKGYRSIKWLSITNEPGWDWSWWLVPPKTPSSITPALAAVRAALDRRGIRVPLSAPDWTDLPRLDPVKIDFDRLIGAYDIHSYLARPEWHPGEGYPMREGLERLHDWVRWAHDRGKPLFLSEVGAMTFGWGGNHPGPGGYDAGLHNAALIVEGLRLGVDGFNRWSFVNRGNLDGQWQLVDTWDAPAGRLRDRFTPHPNAYAMFGLVSRYVAARSTVLQTVVRGGVLDGHARVHATTLRSPRGQLTLIVVNDGPERFDTAVSLSSQQPLFVYQVTERDADRTDVVLVPTPLAGTGAARRLDVPPRSITTISTYALAPPDPGVMTE